MKLIKQSICLLIMVPMLITGCATNNGPSGATFSHRSNASLFQDQNYKEQWKLTRDFSVGAGTMNQTDNFKALDPGQACGGLNAADFRTLNVISRHAREKNFLPLIGNHNPVAKNSLMYFACFNPVFNIKKPSCTSVTGPVSFYIFKTPNPADLDFLKKMPAPVCDYIDMTEFSSHGYELIYKTKKIISGDYSNMDVTPKDGKPITAHDIFWATLNDFYKNAFFEMLKDPRLNSAIRDVVSVSGAPIKGGAGSASIQTNASNVTVDDLVEKAKSKCADLGFAPASEKFGECVLKLAK